MKTVVNGWAIRQAKNGWQIWYWQNGRWNRQGYDNYTEPSEQLATAQAVSYAQA